METEQKQYAAAGLVIGLVCGVVLAVLIGGGWYWWSRQHRVSPVRRVQLQSVPPVAGVAPVPAGQSAPTPPDAVDAWKHYGAPTTPLATPPAIPGPYGALPTARSEIVAGRIGDLVVAAGGFCRQPTYMLDVNELLDLNSRTWHNGTPYPMRISSPAGTVVDDKLFIAGGFDGIRNRSEAYLYDPQTDCWQQLASMPFARSGATAACGSDGRVYVISSEPQAKDPHTVQVYDPASNSWTVPAVPARLGCYGSAMAFDDRIFVFGGSEPVNQNMAAVFVYDITNDRWEIAAPMPQPLCWRSAACWQDRIYLFGGMVGAGVVTSRVDVYDPATDSWTRAHDMAQPRLRLAAVALDEGILLLGGGDGNGNAFNAAELYAP